MKWYVDLKEEKEEKNNETTTDKQEEADENWKWIQGTNK